MEILTISEEQENKLIEMAIVLFPEYGKQKANKYYDLWSIEKDKVSGNTFVCLQRDDGCTRIHWVEFLMVHIRLRMEVKLPWLYRPIVKENTVDYYYNQLKNMK